MEVNVMDTKECIKWLKDAEKAAELNEWRVEAIIKRLQQGEKYRQMWSGLKYEMCRIFDYDVDKTDWLDEMKALEQKYFPKEATHDDKR